MTTTQTTEATTDMKGRPIKPGREYIHPFERSGLARAPYRFVRSYVSKFQACQGAPIQPGTSCDYCATGIMQVYVLRGADGREFKVGCDCVAKACRKGELVLTDVEKAARKHANEMRHAREEVRLALGEAFVARPEVVAFMATAPHPYQYRAERGETLAGFLDAMLAMSGTSGKLRAYKTVKALFEKQEEATQTTARLTPADNAPGYAGRSNREESEMTKLCDYETGSTIREATEVEARESDEAARRDGGAGVILVDGRRCYVELTAEDIVSLESYEQRTGRTALSESTVDGRTSDEP